MWLILWPLSFVPFRESKLNCVMVMYRYFQSAALRIVGHVIRIWVLVYSVSVSGSYIWNRFATSAIWSNSGEINEQKCYVCRSFVIMLNSVYAPTRMDHRINTWIWCLKYRVSVVYIDVYSKSSVLHPMWSIRQSVYEIGWWVGVCWIVWLTATEPCLIYFDLICIDVSSSTGTR